MFLGKLLCSGKFAGFQTKRFTKLDSLLDIEHRFTPTIADVNMNGTMIVTVKKEPIAVLFENCGHGLDCRPAKDSATISFYCDRLGRLTVPRVPLWSWSVSGVG